MMGVRADARAPDSPGCDDEDQEQDVERHPDHGVGEDPN